MIPQLRFPEFTDEWQVKRLGNIGSTYAGLSGKSGDDFGDGANFITYMQIFSDSRIDTTKFAKVRILENERQNKVQKGDIFFTTSSETPREVGYSSVLLSKVDDVYLNSFCFGYRADRAVLAPSFARYLFHSKNVRKSISRLAQGSTRFNLSKNELMKTEICMPSISEQAKIAEFLTAVDERIAAGEKKLELLQKYKKGVMQKIFTQQIRFKDESGNPYPEWEEKFLREVVEFIQNGLSIDQSSTKTGYGVTRIETISDNTINTDKVGYVQTDNDISHYKLQQGDLLFSNINSPAQIGRTVYVDKDYNIYHGMNLLRMRINKQNDAEYIYYVLSSAKYKQWFERICNKAVNQASINQTDLGKTKLNLPSLGEQQKIATFLTALDDKIAAEQTRLTAAKQWKKGLLQRMFV